MTCFKRISFLLAGLFFTLSYFCFAGQQTGRRDGDHQLTQAKQECEQRCLNPEFNVCNLQYTCAKQCNSSNTNQNWKINYFKRINFGNNFSPFLLKDHAQVYGSCLSSGSHSVGAKLNKAYCLRAISEIQNNPNLNNGKKLECPNNDCNQYCSYVAIQDFYETARLFSGRSFNNISACHSAALVPLLQGRTNVESGNPYFESCFNRTKGRAISRIVQEANNSGPQTSSNFRWQGCDLGQPCEQKIENAIANAKSTCTNLHIDMARCCHTPGSCGSGLLGTALKAAATFKNLAGGISERCQMFRDQFVANRGAAATVAGWCAKKVHSCKRGCNSEIAKVKALLRQYCSYDDGDRSWSNKHSCTERFFDRYIAKYRERSCEIQTLDSDGEKSKALVSFLDIPNQCDSSGAILRAGMQDLESTMREMVLTAEACRKQAGGGGTVAEVPPEDPDPVRNPPPPDNTFPDSNPDYTIGGGGEPTEENEYDPPSPYRRRVAADPFGHDQLLGENEGNEEFPEGNAPKSGALMRGGPGGGLSIGGNGGAGSSAGIEPEGEKEDVKENPYEDLIQGFGGSKGFSGYGSREQASSTGNESVSVSDLVEKSAEISLEEFREYASRDPDYNPDEVKHGGQFDSIFAMLSRAYNRACKRGMFKGVPKGTECGSEHKHFNPAEAYIKHRKEVERKAREEAEAKEDPSEDIPMGSQMGTIKQEDTVSVFERVLQNRLQAGEIKHKAFKLSERFSARVVANNTFGSNYSQAAYISIVTFRF